MITHRDWVTRLVHQDTLNIIAHSAWWPLRTGPCILADHLRPRKLPMMCAYVVWTAFKGRLRSCLHRLNQTDVDVIQTRFHDVMHSPDPLLLFALGGPGLRDYDCVAYSIVLLDYVSRT